MTVWTTPVSKKLRQFSHHSDDIRLGDAMPQVSLPLARSQGEKPEFVLLGVPDDTGIGLNHGRIGASQGPSSIREFFYRMAYPMEWESDVRGGFDRALDIGDLKLGTNIEETHSRLFETTSSVSKLGYRVMLVGGGHDFLEPGFLGTVQGITEIDKTVTTSQFSLINVDPHLDARKKLKGVPHSGTSMRGIAESHKMDPRQMIQFGTMSHRNPRENYLFCVKTGMKIITDEMIQGSDVATESPALWFLKTLQEASLRASYIGVSFDIDSCFEVEGSSAAPVVGFSARSMVEMARICGRSPKMIYFEIAEVSPALDPSRRSSRLAAEMIYAFLKNQPL